MSKRKLTNKLISKDDITEELRQIKDSETDYITPIGHIAHLLLWILFLSEHIVPKKPWRCFSDSPWFLGISCDFGKGILPKKLPDFRD